MNIKDAFGFDVFVVSVDGDVTEIETTEDAVEFLETSTKLRDDS